MRDGWLMRKFASDCSQEENEWASMRQGRRTESGLNCSCHQPAAQKLRIAVSQCFLLGILSAQSIFILSTQRCTEAKSVSCPLIKSGYWVQQNRRACALPLSMLAVRRKPSGIESIASFDRLFCEAEPHWCDSRLEPGTRIKTSQRIESLSHYCGPATPLAGHCFIIFVLTVCQRNPLTSINFIISLAEHLHYSIRCM